VLDALAPHVPALSKLARGLAALDALAALAERSVTLHWCAPQFVREPCIEIRAGRHPVLEARLAETAGQRGTSAGSSFIANDTQLGPKQRMQVITGPNMGGKSTYIRQAALVAVLAQAGSFVPARRCRLGIIDRLFARIGAGDDLARGASTFLVEMSQTARILNRATPRSLVILDEVGRGTSTFDGLAIAQAVVEHLQAGIGCRTLFATHYLQLAELARLPGVGNAQVLVRQHRDELVFLHQVVPGAADKSWGVHVARLAGVPARVIERARDLLLALEADAASAPKPRRRTAAAEQRSLFDQ